MALFSAPYISIPEVLKNAYFFQITGLITLAFLFFGIYIRVIKNKSQVSEKNKYRNLFTEAKGKTSFNTLLSTHNRFRVGGPAEVLFQPKDLSDLVKILKLKPKEMPITVLGMGSNVLIRDGGIAGLVIKLGKGFTQFSIDRSTLQVEVGAGLAQLKFSKLCAKEGLGGLEFFCGIPGTIGGALRMNAGSHGVEVKDKLVSATLVDEMGDIKILNVEELNYSYRCCGIPKNWIFVSAIFQGVSKNRAEIEHSIEHMLKYRELRQPVNEKTAGCTFANYDLQHPAWKLIVAAGCQGLKYGEAMVSEKHGNFLINTGTATAEDLECLANIVQRRVLEKSGFLLKWEVEIMGVKNESNK